MADDNFVVTAQANDAANRDYCTQAGPGASCTVMCGDGTTVEGYCAVSEYSGVGSCEPFSPCDEPCDVWCKDGNRPDGCDPANCKNGHDCVEPEEGCAKHLGDPDRAAHMDTNTCKCVWDCYIGGFCHTKDALGHAVDGTIVDEKNCECKPKCTVGTPCLKDCGNDITVEGVRNRHCECIAECNAPPPVDSGSTASSTASSAASSAASYSRKPDQPGPGGGVDCTVGAECYRDCGNLLLVKGVRGSGCECIAPCPPPDGSSDPCPECTAIGLPCGCKGSASSRPLGCAGDPAKVAQCDRLGLGHYDLDGVCVCDFPPEDPCQSEDRPLPDWAESDACHKAGGLYYLASDCKWKCWTGPSSGSSGSSGPASNPDSASSAASLPADLPTSSAPFPGSSASGSSDSGSGSTPDSESSQSLDSDSVSRSLSQSADAASRSASQSADEASRMASEDADAGDSVASEVHENELSTAASLGDALSDVESRVAALSADASRVASAVYKASKDGVGPATMSMWASLRDEVNSEVQKAASVAASLSAAYASANAALSDDTAESLAASIAIASRQASREAEAASREAEEWSKQMSADAVSRSAALASLSVEREEASREAASWSALWKSDHDKYSAFLDSITYESRAAASREEAASRAASAAAASASMHASASASASADPCGPYVAAACKDPCVFVTGIPAAGGGTTCKCDCGEADSVVAAISAAEASISAVISAALSLGGDDINSAQSMFDEYSSFEAAVSASGLASQLASASAAFSSLAASDPDAASSAVASASASASKTKRDPCRRVGVCNPDPRVGCVAGEDGNAICLCTNLPGFIDGTVLYDAKCYELPQYNANIGTPTGPTDYDNPGQGIADGGPGNPYADNWGEPPTVKV